MDILSIVTLVALAIAMSMVAITARLLGEERRRSEARVAALAAAAQSDVSMAPTHAAADAEATVRRRSPWSEKPATVAPDVRRQANRAVVGPAPSAPPTRVSAGDFDLRPSTGLGPAPVVTSRTLFGAAEEPSGGSSRLIPAVAFGGLMIAVVAFMLWSTPRGGAEPARLAGGAAAALPAPTATPLELVALRHRRDGERLAISGIVKNPSGARSVKNVNAVVFLFDRNGSFLSSGRAPIDFTTLSAGDESPFVVVVSEPGAVARYRVSFRSDDHVVPHVDRREPGASNTATPAVSRTREAGGAAPAHLVE